MRLQRWSFEVKYKKGAQQVIADTLSRAPLPQLSAANLSGEQIFRAELKAMALDNSGISKATQEKLQEQRAMDPAQVSSPRSYTVVTPRGGEMRRNRAQIRLATVSPPDAQTYMSQQPSASYDDDQPLGQPLPTISAPMTPPPNQRQSPQRESKGPGQIPAFQNRHTDSRLHRVLQQQQTASDETSVHSEAEI